MRFLENQLMNFWFNLKKTSGVLCYNQGLDREENIKLTVKIYIVSTIYVRNFAKKCPGSCLLEALVPGWTAPAHSWWCP